MKPLLIYTMPRTRSTAALMACRRGIKINEPFEYSRTPNYNKEDDTSFVYTLKTLAEYNAPASLYEQMNHPNSATKIFGNILDRYYPGRAWFNQALDTHEVFILVRDFREMIISGILADYFGYSKQEQTEEREIEVNLLMFYTLVHNFSSFLRFYPRNATLVTYDTLPEEFFDKAQVTTEEQHSMTKLHLIKNLDVVEKHIDITMAYFRDEWKDVTGLDIYNAPLAQW